MNLDVQLEGVLFFKAAPVKKSALAKLFGVAEEEIVGAGRALAERLTSGATRLIETDIEFSLVTAPQLDELIESMRKDDMKRDIGKAGAETLAIVLYRGPITRGEIDRIRGVNSSYILRNLLVRGLVERTENARTPAFAASSTLLQHLGVSDRTKLPEFATIMNTLDAYEANLDTTES